MVEDKYFEDYAVGEITCSEEFSVSEQEVATYLRLVRDAHPIHFDREFCQSQFGRPDILVPGCLTLALADAYWATLVTPASPFSPHYATYVKKQNGDPVLYEIDKVMVPYRHPQAAGHE
jgi:acyl dehydratase